MSFPQVLEKIYNMHSSDLSEVGEYLGYTDHEVWEAVGNAGFYAEDGDGAFTISRNPKSDYSSVKVINDIMVALFTNYPDAKVIQIVN